MPTERVRHAGVIALWVLAAVVWALVRYANEHVPDEVRFLPGALLKSIPAALAAPDMILWPVLLLVLVFIARSARRGDKGAFPPVAPILPILVLLPILMIVQVAVEPGTYRNLLRTYPVMMAGSLAAALALVPALPRVKLAGRRATLTVVLFAAVYAIMWSIWTVHRHEIFESAAWDLGYIESALWNTTRGRLFETTIKSVPCMVILGDHFIPIQILVLPFYIVLGKRPETLLVLQSVWLATGAIPLYLVARRRWEDTLAPVLFAGGFLLYPALHIINVFDFHSLALSIPFLFWSFYYLEKESWFSFGLFLFLACLCKEEVPLIGVFWGLYIMIGRRRWVPGLVTSLACALLFWFAVKVWLPGISGKAGFWPLIRYGELGGTFGEAFRTLLTRPVYVFEIATRTEKLEYLVRMLAPLLLLPLFSPRSWLFAVPPLGIGLLSTDPSGYSMADHHVTSPTVALILASILGLDTLSRRLAPRVDRTTFVRAGAVGVICCTFWITTQHWESSVYDRLEPLTRPRDAHVDAGYHVMEMIPPDAPLETQNHLVPHLCHRDRVWVFPEAEGEAPWVLLDISDHGGRVLKGYPLSSPDFVKAVRGVLESNQYGKVAFEDGFLLLSKEAEDRDFDEVFVYLEGVKL